MLPPIEPSPKDELVDKLLTGLTGRDRRAIIATFGCVTCDIGLVCRQCNVAYRIHDFNHVFRPFRDKQSFTEYTISGMCQACQDSVFGISEYEDLT